MNGNKAVVAIVIAIVALVASGLALFNVGTQYQEQGLTGFTGLKVSADSGTATPGVIINQAGAGKVVEFQDGGTPVWSLNDGGGVEVGAGFDLNGQELTLDADADTSITADTDDQVDFEVGGADKLRISAMGPVLVEGSVIALGAAGTITPTNPYQPITSTTAVTASATTAIADGTLTGQVVCLVNENASDAIIIPDAANTNLSGAITLGNDDTLCVLWDGADWLEVSQADN